MNYNLPYRKIFLEDAISKEKTGFSPLEANQTLANKYYWAKRFYNTSLLASLILGYFAVNKRYTGRMVYLGGFGVSSILAFAFSRVYREIQNQCMTEFKCDKNQLAEYVWFYHYAMLDHDNFYETQRKNH